MEAKRRSLNNDPFSGGRGTPLFFLVRLRERKRKVGKRGRRLVEKKKKRERNLKQDLEKRIIYSSFSTKSHSFELLL